MIHYIYKGEVSDTEGDLAQSSVTMAALSLVRISISARTGGYDEPGLKRSGQGRRSNVAAIKRDKWNGLDSPPAFEWQFTGP